MRYTPLYAGRMNGRCCRGPVMVADGRQKEGTAATMRLHAGKIGLVFRHSYLPRRCSFGPSTSVVCSQLHVLHRHKYYLGISEKNEVDVTPPPTPLPSRVLLFSHCVWS